MRITPSLVKDWIAQLALIAGVLLLSVAPAHAGPLTPADLSPLISGAYGERKEAIEKLVNADPAIAQPLLQSLSQGTLLGLPDGRVVIKSDQGYTDPLTGDAVAAPTGPTRQPVLNNALRRVIQNALASMSLFAEDKATRRMAIDNMLSRPDSLSAQQLEQAIKTETDTALKQKLDTLHAFAVAADSKATPEQRLPAVQLLASVNLSYARTVLNNIISEDNDPANALSVAATESLSQIDARARNSALANNAFTGLSLGSVLVLAALGLAVIYGLIGVINMAHGEFLMLGAYATYLTQRAFQTWMPQWFDYYLLAALPVAFLTAAAVGIVIEWLIIRHLYGRPLESLLATFGVSLLMMQTVRLIFGAQNVDVTNPGWMSGSFAPLAAWLPAFVVPYNRLIILAFSIAVVICLYLVLNRTRLGLFIRACTQNRTMAACVGIRTRKVDASAFALGTGIAGLGGVALSQIGNVGPDLGQAYVIDSFMAVVLGGVGQLIGTVLGAFGLGVLSKLGEPLLGPVLVKIVILLLIVAFIQKRPQGLFAQKGRSAVEA
ncbi:urea ABC transporter permease subunit UrtB [Advenella mimigardefordensis]|uniref:Putative urea ABC transporter permease protein UrtB n=1 Tax=Advenella mimigardefordensis (strain DSM 17166 / LMG 22922 / DPN7) TaxID=1247726 RepID=W0PBP8_ADVMD|nr:urea ABC transporter permease subunit UrtB [Advenella mimigardefordensis]AHG64284.1 putative urea ABC transporter permease protein UrtB [Advenella mimigardefordensis DPN7]